jgi:class 3 adenylate cyclase
MLEGFDDEWQYVGNRRFTSYTNLPSGQYRFRVKASNKDEIWNERGTYVNLEITPPAWRTWWAYSVYGIFFLGFLVGFVQYRISSERSKKQRLEWQKEKLETEVQLRTIELAEEKEKGESLLRNILPGDIADQLIRNGKVEPRKYDEVSILFTDFENFTDMASSMSAERLVSELNEIFEVFDRMLEANNVEKIKTIGDSYMAVAGVPHEDVSHAVNVVHAALELLEYIEERNRDSSFKWRMRVGVHSGESIAGVVGKKKFTFDIWGDSVIIASRMEATGEPGRVNVSAVTRDLIKDHFNCDYRGKVSTPGKGKLDMYFASQLDEPTNIRTVEHSNNGTLEQTNIRIDE